MRPNKRTSLTKSYLPNLSLNMQLLSQGASPPGTPSERGGGIPPHTPYSYNMNTINRPTLLMAWSRLGVVKVVLVREARELILREWVRL